MTEEKKLTEALTGITDSLRSFVELSLKKDDKDWGDWIDSVARDVEVKCWEKKNCTRKDCPAYKSDCGRCWLLVGSLISITILAPVKFKGLAFTFIVTTLPAHVAPFNTV